MQVTLTRDAEPAVLTDAVGAAEHNGTGPEPDPDASHALSIRRGARIQFVATSIFVVVLIGAMGSVALHRVATREALEDARLMTSALARAVIAPELTSAALNGDDDALAQVDRVVHQRVLHEPIVRVKVWRRGGVVAYSDAHGLIGTRDGLDDDLQKAFADGQDHTDVTDLSRPENRFERPLHRLVEVYLPVRAASGEMVVVETYQRTDSIEAETGKLWRAFLPVLVVVLFALAAIQLPLAILHARRARQHERERERLMRRADDRVEAERLRIAAELHDGVVQDLVGVAYELRAVADELPEQPGASHGHGLGDILHRSEQSCRTAVRALRSLLLELHPSERRAETLEAALSRLAAPLRERGVAVPISVRLRRIPPVDVSELVHRTVQEALRNVDRHAGARTAEVTLTDDGSAIRLCVHDDGCGMTATDLEEQHAAGHMGLRLLADGIAARGGSLEIESEPGTGTRLTLWLPWR
jgi:two-component system NarL family sensor kinase